MPVAPPSLTHFPRLPLGAALASPAHPVNIAYDLAGQNPTRAALDYGDIASLDWSPVPAPYSPHPEGAPRAREALAAFLCEQGQPTSADQIFLTASTSESYQLLVKLWCAPGDGVLTTEPGYPLIEHICELEGVFTRPYFWHWEGNSWELDLTSLAEALETPRIRLVTLIAPASPIGCRVSAANLRAVAALCRTHQVILVVDEVFSGTRLDGEAPSLRPPEPYSALGNVVVLGGLSKMMGLPQVKLGWMILHGEQQVMAPAYQGLGYLADCALSVGGVIQRNLPALLQRAPQMMAHIQNRALANRRVLQNLLLRESRLTLMPARRGWYTLLRLPQIGPDAEGWAKALMIRSGVKLEPASLYRVRLPSLLVGGLLVEPATFREGWARAIDALSALLEDLLSGPKA